MHGSCQFELLSLHFSSNRVKRQGMKQNGGAQDKGMQIPFLIRGKPLGMSYNVLYKCRPAGNDSKQGSGSDVIRLEEIWVIL